MSIRIIQISIFLGLISPKPGQALLQAQEILELTVVHQSSETPIDGARALLLHPVSGEVIGADTSNAQGAIRIMATELAGTKLLVSKPGFLDFQDVLIPDQRVLATGKLVLSPSVNERRSLHARESLPLQVNMQDPPQRGQPDPLQSFEASTLGKVKGQSALVLQRLPYSFTGYTIYLFTTKESLTRTHPVCNLFEALYWKKDEQEGYTIYTGLFDNELEAEAYLEDHVLAAYPLAFVVNMLEGKMR